MKNIRKPTLSDVQNTSSGIHHSLSGVQLTLNWRKINLNRHYIHALDGNILNTINEQYPVYNYFRWRTKSLIGIQKNRKSTSVLFLIFEMIQSKSAGK